jgi:Leucine-rich repeat (LRR) protein
VLEVNDKPALSEFTIEDNKVAKSNVKVALYESDEYIKDNYALYEIWKSLDGENWCYDGESYQRGTNWNFDKDVDLWCEQPGVQVHSNGRIARIDLSGFGFAGEMSPAIGQLTELVELYLGTHNDTNIIYDPTLDLNRSYLERKRNLFDDQRAYLRSIHPAIQMSEPCARALMEKRLTSPAIALYEQGGKESDIIDKRSGTQTIHKYDMNHGVLKNGLTSLPKEIGNLKKLEVLNIANSPIVTLPNEIAQLESLNSLEIYNCPNMISFPMAIADLPALGSVNISNNKQWPSEEINKGFTALARGASRKSIEIIYARENNLTKLTKEMFGAGATENEGGLEAIGLLDLAFNKISEVEPLGKNVEFIQLYLDNNQISYIPHDSEGYFCGYDDVENFSVNYNQLTKIPNIFHSNALYTMNSVSFAGNKIGTAEDGEICEGEKDGSYKGIKVKTLTLSMNPLKRYPKAFADSNSLFEYIVASACQMEKIEEGCFSHDNAVNHFSFDLSYNNLKKLPKDFHAGNMPYLYGVDLSFNSFEEFPFNPLDAESLTVLAVRSQRNEKGERCLREWPQGIYQHKGLRGLYLGSNDLQVIDDTISTLCYYLDISDNPNIVFDASDICYAWQVGAYILYYDKTQTILNCDAMLE